VEPEVCELRNNTLASEAENRGSQLVTTPALVCVKTLANREPHFSTYTTFAGYHSRFQNRARCLDQFMLLSLHTQAALTGS
jgi:hypothetical protein